METVMRTTMKRWEMSAIGRPNLRLADVAVPKAQAGEILVKVGAVALNVHDKLVIDTGMGLPLNFPLTPGTDMAGTVVSLGEGASRFAVGDRVISTFVPDWIDGKPLGDARTPPNRSLGGTSPGVFSEYVAFPEDWFVAAPKSLDDATASTLPCAGLTAWFGLVERGGLHAGQTVLIEGTGGVSLFGLQIAKANGAEVIITSGSEEKLARAKALGADHGINYKTEDWVEAVWRLTGDRGVDHVLEVVGGAHLGKAVQAVAINGHIAMVGTLDGFEISAAAHPLLLKSPTIQGVGVGHRRALEDLVAAVDRAGLTPVIDKKYTFAELPDALDHLERGAFGKLVLELG
ncbi:zinc-dependent alcohol dehydrogenase family protein [Cupriavidus nantongensis]